jgi:Na+/H+ antiporter NhaC
LLPPGVSIGMALLTRRVLLSLAMGILCGHAILAGSIPSVPRSIAVQVASVTFNPGNFRLVLFSLLVGAFITLIRASGGVKALVSVIGRRSRLTTDKYAYLLTYLLGSVLFLETWSNVLTNCTVVGPLYDRLGISRERLAYFAHTIGINIVAIVIVNSWGAFYLVLLSSQNAANPLGLVLKSVVFNFFSLFSLLLVAIVMASGLTLGRMPGIPTFSTNLASSYREAETANVDSNSGNTQGSSKVSYLAAPVATLILSVLGALYATGNGSFSAGSGTWSVLFAVILSTGVLWGQLLLDRVFPIKALVQKTFEGIIRFSGMGLLIILALSLGDLCARLGTGVYMASLLTGVIAVGFLPLLTFLLGAVMSFGTGTSYGTFSVLVPITLPIAQQTGIDPALMFGASIAGGVFGDNCSPISDTSIITSMAAEIPVIEHVTTQLPYALLAALLAAGAYILVGFT